MSKSRALRNNAKPVVLKISSNTLKADNINFDLNMCGSYWSQSITYNETIKKFQLIDCESLFLIDELMILKDPIDLNKAIVLKGEDIRSVSLFENNKLKKLRIQ